MREATLALIFRGDGENREILLAKKKRGFGMDKWNGPGGKVEAELGELPEECIIRETKEEVGLEISDVEQVGEFDFVFPHDHAKDFHCYLFKTDTIIGEATETEEMAPKWFLIQNIPYSEMWDDDKLWLPLILQGRKLKGSVEFDEDGKVITHKFDEI